MRQHYDGCQRTVDSIDRCSWNIHHTPQHHVARFRPRRSLHRKRSVLCHTAVERVGNDVLLEAQFPGHLTLSPTSAAHRFPESHVEEDEAIPLSTVINRRLKGASTLPELLEVIVERGQDFNHANTSHALNRLAKLYRAYGKHGRNGEKRISPEDRQAVVAEYVEPAVAALAHITHRKLHDYEPWDVATSLWAAAVLRLQPNSSLVSTLLAKASQLADSFMPADASNVLWACAKLQLHPHQLLKHLVAVTVEQVQLFKPHELAILIWGYAKLDYHPGDDLLEAAAEHVVQNIHLFPVQEASNMLWAMARLHYRNTTALQALEQHLLRNKAALKTQDISNALWSCAKLGFRSSHLADELGALAVQQVKRFKPQEVSNVLYAHAVLQHHNPAVMESFTQVVVARMRDFNSQELVNVLWAFGRLRYMPLQPTCLPALLDGLLAERASLAPLALANTVKALAKLRHRPSQAVLDRLAARGMSQMARFKPAEITNMLWGFAVLGVHHSALFDAAIARLQVLLTTQRRVVTSQHVNSVLFSCELLGFCPRELIDFSEAQGLRNLRVRRATSPTSSQQGTPADAPPAHAPSSVTPDSLEGSSSQGARAASRLSIPSSTPSDAAPAVGLPSVHSTHSSMAAPAAVYANGVHHRSDGVAVSGTGAHAAESLGSHAGNGASSPSSSVYANGHDHAGSSASSSANVNGYSYDSHAGKRSSSRASAHLRDGWANGYGPSSGPPALPGNGVGHGWRFNGVSNGLSGVPTDAVVGRAVHEEAAQHGFGGGDAASYLTGLVADSVTSSTSGKGGPGAACTSSSIGDGAAAGRGIRHHSDHSSSSDCNGISTGPGDNRHSRGVNGVVHHGAEKGASSSADAAHTVKVNGWAVNGARSRHADCGLHAAGETSAATAAAAAAAAAAAVDAADAERVISSTHVNNGTRNGRRSTMQPPQHAPAPNVAAH